MARAFTPKRRRNRIKKRYAGLKGCKDYKKAAKIIKDGGYATSLTYVDKLCSIIEKWKLTQYDVKSSSSSKKSIDTLAKEVIAGKWGNGEERKQKLTTAGYDYNAVQKRVNEMLSQFFSRRLWASCLQAAFSLIKMV